MESMIVSSKWKHTWRWYWFLTGSQIFVLLLGELGERKAQQFLLKYDLIQHYIGSNRFRSDPMTTSSLKSYAHRGMRIILFSRFCFYLNCSPWQALCRSQKLCSLIFGSVEDPSQSAQITVFASIYCLWITGLLDTSIVLAIVWVA